MEQFNKNMRIHTINKCCFSKLDKPLLLNYLLSFVDLKEILVFSQINLLFYNTVHRFKNIEMFKLTKKYTEKLPKLKIPLNWQSQREPSPKQPIMNLYTDLYKEIVRYSLY